MENYIESSYKEYSQQNHYNYKIIHDDRIENPVFTSLDDKFHVAVSSYFLVHYFYELHDLDSIVLDISNQLREYFYEKITHKKLSKNQEDAVPFFDVASSSLQGAIKNGNVPTSHKWKFNISCKVKHGFYPSIKATLCNCSLENLFDYIEQFMNYLKGIKELAIKIGKNDVDQFVKFFQQKGMLDTIKENIDSFQVQGVSAGKSKIEFPKNYLSYLQMTTIYLVTVSIYYLILELGLQIIIKLLALIAK